MPRILQTIVELDIPRCSLTYGTAPCTAAGTSMCYNTFTTCQDRANYTEVLEPLRFCDIGAPLPTGVRVLPHILDVNVAPTEIEPEKGLAKRSNVSISMRDGPDNDTGFDKYAGLVYADPDYVENQDNYVLSRRATPMATFWALFKSRVNNYVGRPARVIRTYYNELGVPGTPETESYIMAQFKGPTKGGVTWTLSDPTRLSTKVKAPLTSQGKLAIPVLSGDLTITVGTGQGAEYPSAGYVRIKEEVIRYTSKTGDVLNVLNSTYRAQFGTTPGANKVGDSVQLCEVFDNELVTQVLRRLFNLSGIPDTELALAEWSAEDVAWLGDKYRVTACIESPEDISTLIADLCRSANAVAWWDPVLSKVRFRVIGPKSPSETSGRILTDVANFLYNSTGVTRMDNLRITRSAVSYDLFSVVLDKKEAKNYATTDIAIDVDAESSVEYNDVRSETFYFRWYTQANANAMRAFVNRRVAFFRNAPDVIVAEVDPRDSDITVGQLLDVETPAIVDFDGAKARLRMLVLKRDHMGDKIALTLRTTPFSGISKRYGFIGPVGQPDYLLATPVQREYAYICNALGTMSNGDPGYYII